LIIGNGTVTFNVMIDSSSPKKEETDKEKNEGKSMYKKVLFSFLIAYGIDKGHGTVTFNVMIDDVVRQKKGKKHVYKKVLFSHT